MHNQDKQRQFDMELTNDFGDPPMTRPNPEALIKQADDLCVELISITNGEAGKKDECAKRLVAAIYTLHETFRTHEAAYSEFLKKRGVDTSNSANEFHATAKAVMEHHGRGVKRSSIALYAQACHVMHREGISSTQAVQWLNEPGGEGGKGGKGRTGFGKTKLLWSKSAEGQAERMKKLNSFEAKAEDYVKEKLREVANVPLDESDVDQDIAHPGAAGIALIEYDEQGQPQVRRVLTRSAVKVCRALKACASKSDGDQEAAA